MKASHSSPKNRDAGVAPTIRVLHAVRRRLVLVRLLESCGIFIACGCAFALVLGLTLLLQGKAAMALCAWTLAISAAAGALAGVMRRPTLFDAAAEADRQLALADLLATALSARDASDPWQQTIVALAGERCRTLAPSSVIAHRLGARAWGGIGLSAALVLTVGALSLPASSRQASAIGTAREGNRADAPITNENLLSPPLSTPSARDHRRIEESSPQQDGTATPFEQTRSDIRGAAPGEGTSPSAMRQRMTNADQPASADGSEGSGSTTAAGGNRADLKTADATDNHAGLSTAAQRSTEPSAPWRSVSWPRDRENAQDDLRDRRVPDSARDVVIEYFRPD